MITKKIAAVSFLFIRANLHTKYQTNPSKDYKEESCTETVCLAKKKIKFDIWQEKTRITTQMQYILLFIEKSSIPQIYQSPKDFKGETQKGMADRRVLLPIRSIKYWDNKKQSLCFALSDFDPGETKS